MNREQQIEELKRRATGERDHFDPAAALKASKLDPGAEIDQPPTIISINGKSCMTAGSFSVIIGRAKVRKGFLLGAIATAAVKGRCTLEGIRGFFNNGKTGVLLFDTEQGAYWAQIAYNRIIKAVGTDDPPNLSYYNLQQYTPSQRLQIIDTAIMEHPTLSLVAIDGIRDLISAINDEGQATEMTTHILRWCALKQIHVLCLLHVNKNDSNARGFIGSELVNKTESVISVTKERDEMISTVKHEFSRGMEFQPFSFTVDDDGLPRVTDMIKPVQGRKAAEMADNFAAILPGMKSMNYTELVQEYQEYSGLGVASAKAHISKGMKNGILKKDNAGSYRMKSINNDSEAPF